MRRIHILWAGRRRRRTWEELCTEYRRRIERQVKVHDRLIKAPVAGDGRVRRRAEGRALRQALPEPCWTIALDPSGRMLASEKLARELQRLEEQWPHDVAFLVGSDLGLDEEILAHARQSISFGPLTLGHELARLVLYEQLYRGLAINRGIKYHR